MDVADRIKLAWPDAKPRDVIQVGPLGTRQSDNILLYNRRTGEVATGVATVTTDQGGGHRSCFLASLDAFAAKLDADYAARAKTVAASAYGYGLDIHRLWAEYHLTIAFLRSLPPLETG